jgi:hypothetical protein
MAYTQTVLALDGAVPLPPIISRTHTPHHPPRPVIPAQTLAPAGRRMPDDLWDEYRFECATRGRLHLPEVSLAEFRDMRDWTDRIEENDDEITEPDTDAPPYGDIRRWR